MLNKIKKKTFSYYVEVFLLLGILEQYTQNKLPFISLFLNQFS